MKKRELNLKVGIFFVVLLLLSAVILYEHKNDKKDNKGEPYEFGLEAGVTDIEKYQIPEEDLAQLSTESLAETILTNGFLMQFEAYDSSKYAVDIHMEMFNVYPALFEREDCEKVLLDLYKRSKIVVDSELEKSSPMEYMRAKNIEILLAAKLSRDYETGTETDPEIIEAIKSIHEKKVEERNESESYNDSSDGFLWFEEFYF